MSEWANVWQIIGVISACVIGAVATIKAFHELERIRSQRKKEIADAENAAKLKRIEFFLAQHRRLFDNEELFEVLCLLDEDSAKLAQHQMWDKNRKFLTFIEEIALLVKAGQIDGNTAQYMFGYYACCARDGVNFNVGINSKESYWRLFNYFCDQHKAFERKLADDHDYLPSI